MCIEPHQCFLVLKIANQQDMTAYSSTTFKSDQLHIHTKVVEQIYRQVGGVCNLIPLLVPIDVVIFSLGQWFD